MEHNTPPPRHSLTAAASLSTKLEKTPFSSWIKCQILLITWKRHITVAQTHWRTVQALPMVLHVPRKGSFMDRHIWRWTLRYWHTVSFVESSAIICRWEWDFLGYLLNSFNIRRERRGPVTQHWARTRASPKPQVQNRGTAQRFQSTRLPNPKSQILLQTSCSQTHQQTSSSTTSSI